MRAWRSPTAGSSGRSPFARTLLVRQFSKFALVGVSNTAVSFVAYVLLVRVGVLYLAAGAIAFAFGAVNGYLFNRAWTFASPDSPQARLKYLVVQLAGLGTTVALLRLFVSDAGLGRIAGYAVTTPTVTVATFLANRCWTFRAGVR